MQYGECIGMGCVHGENLGFDTMRLKENYKVDQEEQYVGFIAEDVPDLVATNDRKGMSPMDVTAVLTKVVQEQQQQIELLKMEIEALKNMQ